MRTLPRLARCAVALLLLGCPADPPPKGVDPSVELDRTEPAPPPPATPPQAGPAGPTGPAPVETPRPDDGRDQLGLLDKRVIKVGGHAVSAWIADTDPRRQLGLMHVRALPTDHGMLFVYPDVRPRTFWMKNTLIPLSIAYIDENGVVDSILDMRPLDLSHYPSKGAVRFGLEMTQGWFAERGIEPGARVEGIVDLPGYH